tara:strand:+ start:363 stop:662 length:300 start_codon:yes stop_codon:yes gene_type:complete
MSRYQSGKIIKDENGKRKSNTIIVKAPPFSENDVFIEITSPERLDLLAFKFYNDASLWWIIAEANGLGKGTLFTPEGITIRIPNSENIQEFIEQVNNNR